MLVAVVAACVVGLPQVQLVAAVEDAFCVDVFVAALNSGCQLLMLVAMFALSTLIGAGLAVGFGGSSAGLANAADAASATANGSANTELERLIVIVDASNLASAISAGN
jgi:hypothetical protein